MQDNPFKDLPKNSVITNIKTPDCITGKLDETLVFTVYYRPETKKEARNRKRRVIRNGRKRYRR